MSHLPDVAAHPIYAKLIADCLLMHGWLDFSMYRLHGTPESWFCKHSLFKWWEVHMFQVLFRLQQADSQRSTIKTSRYRISTKIPKGEARAGVIEAWRGVASLPYHTSAASLRVAAPSAFCRRFAQCWILGFSSTLFATDGAVTFSPSFVFKKYIFGFLKFFEF